MSRPPRKGFMLDSAFSSCPQAGVPSYIAPGFSPIPNDVKWFAVFTLPKNEHSVARRLEMLKIGYFLPTYEVSRLWKNRQRIKLSLPLFPNYLFVHIPMGERWRVLSSPGVVNIVGNSKGPIPIESSEIEFLRSARNESRLEPFQGVLIGQRVHVKAGPMTGVEGTLVRIKGGGLRFVLSLQLINMHAAIEVNAQDVEPLPIAV